MKKTRKCFKRLETFSLPPSLIIQKIEKNSFERVKQISK